MVKKILIDVGMGGGTPCTGRREDASPSHAYRIGRKLADQLDRMGYEILFSGDIPELDGWECGAGRPAACASVAKRWGADCLFRLCVRSAELPTVGTVRALVYRRDAEAWRLAESVLRSVQEGSDLISRGIRPSTGVLLLRRTPCTSMVLVPELPFRQQEFLSDDEAELYASCMADGIDTWARNDIGRGTAPSF